MNYYDLSNNNNLGYIVGATWSNQSLAPGCSDPFATNYDIDSNFDNNSCEYQHNGDYSLSFDGNNDYVHCGNDESL